MLCFGPYTSIAETIREARNTLKLTQKQMAEIVGLSESRISQLEAKPGEFKFIKKIRELLSLKKVDEFYYFHLSNKQIGESEARALKINSERQKVLQARKARKARKARIKAKTEARLKVKAYSKVAKELKALQQMKRRDKTKELELKQQLFHQAGWSRNKQDGTGKVLPIKKEAEYTPLLDSNGQPLDSKYSLTRSNITEITELNSFRIRSQLKIIPIKVRKCLSCRAEFESYNKYTCRGCSMSKDVVAILSGREAL